jgi:exoribonuclease R
MDISKQTLLDYFKVNNSFVGILSTSQQVKYGKTKAGKPIYQIHPLKKILPPFWITYGGKLTGRIIIQFKFKEWSEDSKLPFGEIISILGVYSPLGYEDTNLINVLLYHYQVERKPFVKKLPELNDFEKELVRKKLNDLTIFSIDPKGCIDIDDALSYEKISDNTYKVGVHIAQPICWLTKEEIIERSQKAISTLYLNNDAIGNKNLWSDEITEKASLFVNQEKPAYSIIFTISDNKIISTESFPSIITNKLNTDYDNIEYPFIKDCKTLTEKIIGKEIDSHELVSHWMIMANQYIGSTFENIPFLYVGF